MAKLLGGHCRLVRVELIQLWWYGGSRGQEGLGTRLRQWRLSERSQGLLWAIEVRGGVLVEGALDRAWKDPLDTGEGRR